MTGPRTVALVESATQLLNVVEWAHAADAADGLRIAVLPPRDPHTVVQLARVAALAAHVGAEIGTVDIRSKRAEAVTGGLRLTRELARADRVVLGDPFSRLIQTLLPVVRAEDVVVVDDGTATWEFASCIDARRPLVRWREPLAGSLMAAARATRHLTPGPARRLTVFTCLEAATPVGAVEQVNAYAWTRAHSRPEVRDGEIDVIGASLVETGVVERDAYLQAVRRLTRRFTPVRYLAHRRESPERLAEIGSLPGVRVVRPELPVELALRQGPVARHVIAFPSTAAHTLPVVLGDLDVRLEVRGIEAGWFTAATTPHAREFVRRIADDAPVRPVLEIA